MKYDDISINMIVKDGNKYGIVIGKYDSCVTVRFGKDDDQIYGYASCERLEPAKAQAIDNVNSPNHYTAGGIEVIDVLKAKMTESEFKGFLRGNVIKYLLRAELKGNEEQDYQKAKWYLERLLKEVATVETK